MPRQPDTDVQPHHWRSPDERHLPAHFHPALLIELAQARDVPEHRLLRHTGLFTDDIVKGKVLISDHQYRRLLDNVQQHCQAEELALLWGRQMLPGHYGPLSTCLQHAPNLAEALTYLHDYRHDLCPLLFPQWWRDSQWCYLLWADGGTGRVRPFVARAMMAAVYGLARYRTGRTPEWHFLFSQRRPANPAAHEVSLGGRVWFGTGVDMMILPLNDLNEPWLDSSTTALSVARHQLPREPVPESLPEVVYHLLMARAEALPSLEETAGILGMSAASLKRRLRDCGTHFQSLCDEVRLHYSLYLSQVLRLGTEAIAERLCNGDRANFRRSFRRWTGMTPARYRQWLMP
ncbi:AraC family transcriptional regulator [Halovibrio salipaludis]|nr:AraC family transcriptional regulator [Halovibrio salipaludis]